MNLHFETVNENWLVLFFTVTDYRSRHKGLVKVFHHHGVVYHHFIVSMSFQFPLKLLFFHYIITQPVFCFLGLDCVQRTLTFSVLVWCGVDE